jgi:tetratricopeptide (TPR) repeat protein
MKGNHDPILHLILQSMANIYKITGQHEESLAIDREVYAYITQSRDSEHYLGTQHEFTAALNLGISLLKTDRHGEAKTLLREAISSARIKLGDNHDRTLCLLRTLAQALFMSHDATREDLNEAVDILEDNLRVTRQIYGREHPEAKSLEQNLGMARMFQMMPRPGDGRPAAPPAEERDPGYFMHQAMKHLTEAFDISHV